MKSQLATWAKPEINVTKLTRRLAGNLDLVLAGYLSRKLLLVNVNAESKGGLTVIISRLMLFGVALSPVWAY